jgi:hypothetical protein
MDKAKGEAKGKMFSRLAGEMILRNRAEGIKNRDTLRKILAKLPIIW